MKENPLTLMKSGLIRPFPLETDTTVNASWHVSTCLPQVFKAVSERRETRPRQTSCKQDLGQDTRYRHVNRSWKFRYKIIRLSCSQDLITDLE